MCDKKNKVLFTDSECLVLSPEFKLPDENQVLLKVPRQNNMYSFNLENIVPSGGLACLIAKATTDESNKWHRSTPISTASSHDGLSLSDPTNPEQDDSEIPPLEDIYQNSTDGIFTNSSYDDEGAMADFTNLETVVNVSPIPTSRIISSHPSALILGDPTSVVQTRSKVNKSSGAHAFVSYKASLVAHRDMRHEEGIESEEVVAPVAGLKPLGSFLAFAFYMGFIIQISSEVYKEVKALLWLQPSSQSQKPLVKDEESSDVDVHLYRSMIGSLMYLTASRPDIMFAVCACSRFQVTPKSSHLSAVKRIFRRLISWQCKKQTIVATSTTEAEYVAAAAARLFGGQVLMDSKQMLDYGFIP
ncbi:hypothetical protein Tco_0990788 [Tanacetum coccineum]|uniref:Reverse transcriptase Ty1/copia-type domain-containing protein n=1 Tax=Tanacetum coccineum TaxID=301880 RepID=A0ABQ5EY50_9ASTR